MVVPRSAHRIAADDEYTLFSVTTFKKHGQDFIHKSREHKWIPRDFKFKEGGKEEEEKEVVKTKAEEKRVWGEALRLGRTGYSESVMSLVHVIVLRCFVESVLRYGLPIDFVVGLVKVSSHRFQDDNTCHTNLLNRRIPNVTKDRGKVWTKHSHIWRAMLLGKTRKAGRRRTRVCPSKT